MFEQKFLILKTFNDFLKRHPICIVEGTLNIAFVLFFVYQIVSKFFDIEIKVTKKNENTIKPKPVTIKTYFKNNT